MNFLETYGADKRLIEVCQMNPALVPARVVSQSRELYRIVSEQGEMLAEVSGRFRYDATSVEDYPAVGDFVLTDATAKPGEHAMIRQVLPRRSLFTRKAAGSANTVQVVAANIDIAFLCMSLNQNMNPSRLERYLAVAWESGATPVVTLTKADLCMDVAAALARLAPITVGVDVLVTSGEDAHSCEPLLAYLKPGVTACFLGSSGVGKSTLINRLIGEERMPTFAIGQMDKGRHTTTSRELVRLPQGGMVIDTPGMRELGVDAVDLNRSFADIDELANLCRFGDCTHDSEPGCAVQAAVRAGTLEPRRLESYRKLQREATYDGLNAKQREHAKINNMFGGKRAMKQMINRARERNR